MNKVCRLIRGSSRFGSSRRGFCEGISNGRRMLPTGAFPKPVPISAAHGYWVTQYPAAHWVVGQFVAISTTSLAAWEKSPGRLRGLVMSRPSRKVSRRGAHRNIQPRWQALRQLPLAPRRQGQLYRATPVKPRGIPERDKVKFLHGRKLLAAHALRNDNNFPEFWHRVEYAPVRIVRKPEGDLPYSN
jgi:hypothetical protein